MLVVTKTDKAQEANLFGLACRIFDVSSHPGPGCLRTFRGSDQSQGGAINKTDILVITKTIQFEVWNTVRISPNTSR